MKTVTLGRTGLDVSIAGLGCGGPSRLGMRGDPAKKDHAVQLVKTAMDLGVTFIDTAESYGTEEAVGEAVRGRRDKVVISSKQGAYHNWRDGPPKTGGEYLGNLDASLAKLGTDYLDLYHVHGVITGELDHTLSELVPAMEKARAAGKIRHLALSEAFERDFDHTLLQQLLERSDAFDVLMVGFNLLNPSARKSVFPVTQDRGVGTLCMFAVRRAMSNAERRAEVLAEMHQPADALDFLLDYAATIPEAAYRFAAHEPGMDIVLFGTGNEDHLRANVEACNMPPLPDEALAKLRDLFGDAASVSGS